jgi:hypothetical protein
MKALIFLLSLACFSSYADYKTGEHGELLISSSDELATFQVFMNINGANMYWLKVHQSEVSDCNESRKGFITVNDILVKSNVTFDVDKSNCVYMLKSEYGTYVTHQFMSLKTVMIDGKKIKTNGFEEWLSQARANVAAYSLSW